MFLVFGVLLLVIGLVMIFFPNVVYSITELWKSNDYSEASDTYKVFMRIRGIVCFALGVFFIVAYFILPI